MKNKKKTKIGFRLGFVSGMFFLLGTLFSINVIYQIYKKPAELISLLSFSSAKTISQTWKSYKKEFKSNSTSIITAKYLAALAQVESAGNPLASPDWDMHLHRKWYNWLSPQTSAVGLFQFTKGTFEKAKRYCVRNNKSVDKNCWFNNLFLRVWPSHSIEVASAYLDQRVKKILGKQIHKVTSKNRKRLASIIHLCGSGKGLKFYRSGFKLSSVPRCGSHKVSYYIYKIEKFENKLKQRI